MAFKVPSVDEVFSKLHKRQKYLGIRMLILFSLIIFTYNPILLTKNVDEVVLLNATLLLSLPILVEYYLGFDTYSNGTNGSRWIGFFISGLIASLCLISYMGGVAFQFDDGSITGFSIFGWYKDIVYWKVLIWILPIVAIMDWIFSLGPDEIRFYELQDNLDKDILDKLSVAKAENVFAKKVEKEKQGIMEAVPKEE